MFIECINKRNSFMKLIYHNLTLKKTGALKNSGEK